MKKFILLVITIFFFHYGYSQKSPIRSITGSFQNEPLENVLRIFEREFDIKFSYIQSLTNDVKVTGELNQEPLEHALHIILENTSFDFQAVDEKNFALIKDFNKKPKNNKRYTLKGIISDDYGQPLDSVEVYVPMIQKSVLSNPDGSYKVTNLPKGRLYINYRKEQYYKFTEFINLNDHTETEIQLSKVSRHSKNEATILSTKAEDINLLHKKIEIAFKSGTVQDFLKEMESQAALSFSFNSDEIPLQKNISINDSLQTVGELLNEIFKDTRIEFIEWDKKIILKKRKPQAVNFTISGTVKDKRTGEFLPGANVVLQGQSLGTTTNSYGFYSLTVPEWDYNLTVSYMGYKQNKKELSLINDIRLDIELEENMSQLREVLVTGETFRKHIETVEMSVATLDIKSLKKMPAFMGEVDLIKGILMLPGVTTVGEGATGFNVRGGGVDQNLVLLDEAQVFNTSHLFGFFSVFNADAIKDSKLYKGGIPANYGGRLSSVLDISQKEGNNRGFEGSGGIGLVSSRLTVEGPIVKNKGSFIVAGRRSYADVFFKNDKLVKKLDLPSDNEAFFYDLNAKINYKLSDKNKVFISGYFGRDNYRLGKEVAFDWGNTTATLRWNHLFSEKLFSNVTAVYSNYTYTQGEPEGYFAFKGKTGIKNYNLKSDFTYFPNTKHKVDFGIASQLFEIEPGKLWPTNDSSSIISVDLTDDYTIESAAYLSNEFKFNSRLTVYAGLRFSHFMNIGPGKYHEFEAGEPRSFLSLQDTILYNRGEIVNTNSGFEPRISLKWNVDNASSVKLSYNRMIQYLHLISNTTAATPLDIWKASNKNITPQVAHQLAIGYFRNFRENTLEASIELYYKKMQNLVDYKNGADLIGNELLDADLLQGKGRAYGIELLVNKKVGRLTGWTSYTYSRTERRITADDFRDQINYGDWYPANYDQPHKLNIVALYQISRRFSFSSNFTYNTGRPVTYPDAQYVYLDVVVPHYSTRNLQRIPDYHRLDASMTLDGRGNKRWKSSWSLSFYNLYARKNAYSIFFRQVQDTRNTESVKLSIIGSIIPSLSYNFKF